MGRGWVFDQNCWLALQKVTLGDDDDDFMGPLSSKTVSNWLNRLGLGQKCHLAFVHRALSVCLAT